MGMENKIETFHFQQFDLQCSSFQKNREMDIYDSDINGNSDAETVCYDEELTDVDKELDQISIELAKLKRRLDSCLQIKRDELKKKIRCLSKKIEMEQDALSLVQK